MKRIYIVHILVILLCIPWNLYAQGSTSHNYIITVTPLDATDTVIFQGTDAHVAGTARAAVGITYYDGLGRPVQVNQRNATPQGQDIVTLTEYNGLDKIHRQWNATPFTPNSGQYIDSLAFATQARQVYNDNVPYTSTLYETSALHRVNAQQKAGVAWQGKQQKIRYRLNGSNEVLHLEVLNDSTLVCKGYYAAGALQKVVTTDEDRNSTTTYTDKQGRTLMQKVGDDACTYYVYNFLGQLAYVLPPALSIQISSGNYTDNHERMKQYAYVYKCDERGNCVSKRLPGCEPLYMVYDQGGRLAQTQDGNQRARGSYWTVCMYDSFNRILYTAEVLTGQSTLQEAITFCKDKNMKTSLSNMLVLEDTGYFNYYYRNKPTKLLTVNYYDTYDFLPLLPDSIETALAFAQHNGYDAAILDTAQLHGRLTGTRTYNLSDNNYVTTANYYDRDGRLVQQRSTNQLGGMNNTYLALDYTGNILQQFTTHTAANEISVTEHYAYTYDHANRLLSTTYQHNDDEPIVLNSFQYDELGRVRCKRIYDAVDSIRYQYNIQNWVTNIQSDEFEEKIYYEQPIFTDPNIPTYANYNGNISANTWTYQGQTNGYMYHYDDYNRFYFCYSILDSIFAENYYSENMTYDKSGNITRLTRWDNQDAMNMLWYTYDGNQVTKVTDEGYGPVDYDCKRYIDHANTTVEMGYDDNGNLIYDLDRQIVAIRYNILNLPDTVQFANGNQIINYYDALGTRYKTSYRTRKVAATVPVPLGTTLTATDNLSDYTMITHAMDKNIKYLTYGNDALILDYVFNSEGYIRYYNAWEHYRFYYIKDHLGNVRETYVNPAQGSKLCAQRMQYYPSGLPWNDNLYASEQPYKYNGKEFVEMHGLDEYDSEARWYYPALGRTTTMDPLCEKYYNISPYAWCGNNPTKFVDPTGKWIETAWDVANVALDVQSFWTNIQAGNVGAAVVDGAALVLDVAATILPAIPGGVGTAVKAARSVDKVNNVVKGVNKSSDTPSIIKRIPANGGRAKPHGGNKHNSIIDQKINDILNLDGVTEIRKNQIQVDVDGNRVGNNRPDIQYDKDGVHYNIEVDNSHKNSINHGKTIQKNDPNSNVELIIIE